MSLNGLEDAKVQEAFEAAAAEPGGWFLLQYASRDEVELLGRGTGGIVEVRNAIAKYEESSPLYGFLRYRRRNVILKYMPEDCSRLVQARSAVHYNAICERFSPYDTTFEISVAKDLKDSKLSAACSLHAASGSSSSSCSSLRRRRLNEIAEEEEEEERERKRQSIVHEEERPKSSAQSHVDAPTSPPANHPAALDPEKLKSPPDTTFSSLNEPPSFNGAEHPTSPEGRLSSQTTRPDLYSYATYTYGKPKVKLGPRPSLDVNKRPHTAGNFRPIAALPAGFKGFSKGSKKGKTDDKSDMESEQKEEVPPEGNPTASTNLLEVPKEAEQQPLPPRPATSSGASVKSVAGSIAVSSFQSATKESNKMTPEKARLMKAMKLREKKKNMNMNMNASNLAESNTSPATHNDTTIEEEVDTALGQQSKTTRVAEREEHSSSVPPSDSGVSVDPPTPKSVNTEARSYGTTSDSHPPSPTAASMSEIGDSTKASSLSESTDETIQANKEAAGDSGEENDYDNNDNSNNNSSTHANGQDAQDEEQSSNLVMEDDAGSKMRPVETDEPTQEGPNLTPEAPPAETLKEVISEDGTSTDIPLSQTLSQESQQILGPHTSSLPTTEPEPAESSRDTDASAVTSKPPAELRTTDLDTPPTGEDDSAKSVLGVPRSRFSTSEPKSSRSSSSSSRSSTLLAPKLRSKFTTQDLEDASGSTPPQPSISISISISTPADVQIAKESQPSKEENRDEVRQQGTQEEQGSLVISPKSSRQKSTIEPIRTDLTAKKTPQSEVSDPMLDDALMDELQSAEVQEARPMRVSKSPITPVFPASNPSKSSKDDNAKNGLHLVRAVSNPMRGPLLVPSDVSQSSARSVSAGGAAFLHKITRQPSNAALQSKKGGIGSSISQRIKALEKLSTTTDDGRPKTATPTSSFYTVKKGIIQQASKSPSGADHASSLTRGSPDPDEPREHIPDEAPEKKRRGRSGSVANRLTMFESHGLKPPRGRPESIQVTARILRDHTQDTSTKPETRRDPNDFGPVELKESPLIIDVRKSEPGPQVEAPAAFPPKEKETIIERRMSRDLDAPPEDVGKKARRPSLGIVKDFLKERRASVMSKSTDNLPSPASPNKTATRPPSAHSNYGSIVRRMSTSSRRSLSYDRDSNGNSGPMGSPSVLSDTSGDDEKSAKSRASRFMRRLSNSFGPSRKNVTANISPTLPEEPADEISAPSTARTTSEAQPSISAYIGDVNVQFPDNLLWKRRSMCLDSGGWLILSAVQGAAASGKDKAGIKRFHLSDFRAPYTPDVDVQELPNSVRLDLVEGSCLQIACEDRNGQMNVLRSLQEAHRSHSSFGH